jgi:hypothetical protein
VTVSTQVSLQQQGWIQRRLGKSWRTISASDFSWRVTVGLDQGSYGIEVLSEGLRKKPLEELTTRTFNTIIEQFR